MRSSFRRMVISVLWAIVTATALAATADDANEQLKAALRRDVGEGCEIRETAHWLIASKADVKWVDAAARMLERTHDFFFEQFKKAGFEPQPLRQTLVCVLLGDQEEFAQYLERVRDSSGQPAAAVQPAPDNRPEPGKAKRPAGLGSYSERTNQIQMCDIRAIVRKSARPQSTSRAELENVVRIAHEAAHQLSFNTDILKQRTGYPMWLGEGLAANFEFSDADQPFGPLTDNLSLRVGQLKQLDADGKLMPLKQMVTMSPYEAHQPDNKGLTYVQGCAFFRFLFRQRPKQLRQYLAAWADRPRGPVRRSQVLEVFEAAFGPIDELEKDWRQSLNAL